MKSLMVENEGFPEEIRVFGVTRWLPWLDGHPGIHEAK